MAGVSAPRLRNKYIIIERIVKRNTLIQKFVSGGGNRRESKIHYNYTLVKSFLKYMVMMLLYLVSYLFLYKILQNGKTYKCGYPDSFITKITNKLCDLKISYQNYISKKKSLCKRF